MLSDGKQRDKCKSSNYYMVYKCKGCNKYSVFDNYPVRERPLEAADHPKPSGKVPSQGGGGPLTTTTSLTLKKVGGGGEKEKCRMAQLQKILQRSRGNVGGSTATASSSSPLSDFLQGLHPKLTKKF